MIIKEIELKDFISHPYTKLDFEQGITIIIGDNGAGKTTILDGISFGLLKEHSRGKIDNLV
ncbi:MAG: AAA family ATPase, partial [Candidatus Helarchaeota archaeon]|nr:AAA family ATPase [Candidatus Helarchaeota archaeon]